MQHMIFDLNNTIIKKKYSYFEIFSKLVNEKDISNIKKNDGIIFDNYINSELKLLTNSKLNLLGSSIYWITVFENAIKTLTIKNNLDTYLIATSMYKELGKMGYWFFYEDVLDTIDILNQKNITYGFLSNWDDRMEKLWRELSLTLNVQNSIAVFSYNTNCCKPDTKIFKEYITLVNKKHPDVSKIIMFGDDLVADQGGESLGIQFCHVNRLDPQFNLTQKVKGFII